MLAVPMDHPAAVPDATYWNRTGSPPLESAELWLSRCKPFVSSGSCLRVHTFSDDVQCLHRVHCAVSYPCRNVCLLSLAFRDEASHDICKGITRSLSLGLEASRYSLLLLLQIPRSISLPRRTLIVEE